MNHHEPHFNTEPGAVDLYRAFQAEFAAACGDPKSDDAIARACAEIRRQRRHRPNQAVASVGSTGNRDNGEN